MWGHHGFFFFPFGIIFLLLIGGIVLRMILFRRYGRRCRGTWHDDAETILRRRIANGEIEEAEYHKRLETLKK